MTNRDGLWWPAYDKGLAKACNAFGSLLNKNIFVAPRGWELKKINGLRQALKVVCNLN
jgi:hypothetical protein